MKFMLFALSFFLATQAQAGQATAVSADAAHTALAQGAYVMDLRTTQAFATGHLPQAANLPADAAKLPLLALAAMLEKAGVDSSRTMLVMGEAGDANAQALWQRLSQVTSGRVLWLVGGVQEWQMRGYALTTQGRARLAVPQFLAPFDAPSKVRSLAQDRQGAMQFALH
jgi:3-mercaptopyruvate sulfurtransferase SseA